MGFLAFAFVLQGGRSMTITQSTKLKPNAVRRIETKGDLSQPAILVKGNRITVDFNQAIIEGGDPKAEPDRRKGLGLKIEGDNITIKNLRIRGYKVGIMARNCRGLKLIDCDASDNWKQHLASTPEQEDESDWMSYHRNENDEWLRYGAAIYLRGCSGFEARGCQAERGQCGLMMTDCAKGKVWNCDFSFLSGIGVGLYRSSDNRIMNNRIDWCVRGFSYGVYNRGQDSAGILVYEQSSRNVFAYNSVTHGGDGFFLWAGQTTMDTGKGGCNDNLLYGNDFSHAATNGIEATFSRNAFVNNLVLECWHGIWGGYSYDSKVIGNVFGYNAEGIAWEHGQDDLVQGNLFYRDQTSLHIWANASQDPNWVYAKKRDTRSRNWTIDGNTFSQVPGRVLTLTRSQDFAMGANRYGPARGFYEIRGPMGRADIAAAVSGESRVGALHLTSLAADGRAEVNFLTNPLPDASALVLVPREFKTNWNPLAPPEPISIGPGKDLARIPASALALAPKSMTSGLDPFLKPGTLRGWRYILVDQWGPYDFKRPLLYPREELKSGRRFEILGPKGRWRLVKASPGVRLNATSGETPGLVDVSFPSNQGNRLDIDLEYIGAATTDYRGIVTPAGKPVRFGWSKFFAPIDWTVRFYKWTKPASDQEHAAPDEAALKQVLKGDPIKELKSTRLDFAGSAFDPLTGNDHFLTAADGTFSVAPGDYTLELTADDGARLWLDGKPLIEDAWHYQGPTLYTRKVHLGPEPHRIRVEHFQIDGFARLKVDLKPIAP